MGGDNNDKPVEQPSRSPWYDPLVRSGVSVGLIGVPVAFEAGLDVASPNAYAALHPSGDGGRPDIAGVVFTSTASGEVIQEPGGMPWFDEFIAKTRARQVTEFIHRDRLTPGEIRSDDDEGEA